MAQSKLSRKHKMLIGLSTQHEDRQTYMIHVLEDWTTDENDENEIFITSRDICTNNKVKNHETNDISEYVLLKPINRRAMKIGKTYYALFKIPKKKQNKKDKDKNKKLEDVYTSVYYQCKVKEKQSIPPSRTTIRIKFRDDEKVYSSRFRCIIRSRDLPVVIDPQPLTAQSIIDYRGVNIISSESEDEQSNIKMRLRNYTCNKDKSEKNKNDSNKNNNYNYNFNDSQSESDNNRNTDDSIYNYDNDNENVNETSNDSDDSMDKNKRKKRRARKPAISMKEIAASTGVKKRKKKEKKIPKNCDMNQLNPEILQDMDDIELVPFMMKHGVSQSERIAQQMNKIFRIQNGQGDEQLSSGQLQQQTQSVIKQTLEIAKNGGDDISSIQISYDDDNNNINSDNSESEQDMNEKEKNDDISMISNIDELETLCDMNNQDLALNWLDDDANDINDMNDLNDMMMNNKNNNNSKDSNNNKFAESDENMHVNINSNKRERDVCDEKNQNGSSMNQSMIQHSNNNNNGDNCNNSNNNNRNNMNNNSSSNSNNHSDEKNDDQDTLHESLLRLLNKFQDCNYASSHDICKIIQETETFIAQASKDKSNPGLYDTLNSITSLLNTLKNSIENKKNSNDNSSTMNNRLCLNTTLLETSLNFLNEAYGNNIKHINTTNENNENVNVNDNFFDNNDIGDDFGIGGSSPYNDYSLSMKPSDEHGFGPSRGMRYKSCNQRDEPYYAEPRKSGFSIDNNRNINTKNKNKSRSRNKSKYQSDDDNVEVVHPASISIDNVNDNLETYNSYSCNNDDANKIEANDDWDCTVCTYINNSSSTRCQSCNEKRNSNINNVIYGNLHGMKNDQRNNNNNDNDNNANNDISLDYYDSIDINSNRNNTKNKKWRCTNCLFRNKHSLEKCHMCKKKKYNHLMDDIDNGSESANEHSNESESKESETSEIEYVSHTSRGRTRLKKKENKSINNTKNKNDRNKNKKKNSNNSNNNSDNNSDGNDDSNEDDVKITFKKSTEEILIGTKKLSVAEIIDDYNALANVLPHEVAVKGMGTDQDGNVISQIGKWSNRDILFFYWKIREFVNQVEEDGFTFRNGRISTAQWLLISKNMNNGRSGLALYRHFKDYSSVACKVKIIGKLFSNLKCVVQKNTNNTGNSTNEDEVNKTTQRHLKNLNERRNATNKQIDARLQVASGIHSLTTAVANVMNNNNNNNNGGNNINNVNGNRRNVMDFLMSSSSGAGVLEKDIQFVRSFYFTAPDKNKNDFIAAYDSMNKNGSCDKVIWTQLKQIIKMINAQGK